MERVQVKSAKKRKKRTRSEYIFMVVGILIVGSFLCTLVSQQLRLSSIRRETEQCRQQIALTEKEYEKSSESAKNSTSDAFYEKKARDEGYVRADETVFVIGN